MVIVIVECVGISNVNFSFESDKHVHMWVAILVLFLCDNSVAGSVLTINECVELVLVQACLGVRNK